MIRRRETKPNPLVSAFPLFFRAPRGKLEKGEFNRQLLSPGDSPPPRCSPGDYFSWSNENEKPDRRRIDDEVWVTRCTGPRKPGPREPIKSSRLPEPITCVNLPSEKILVSPLLSSPLLSSPLLSAFGLGGMRARAALVVFPRELAATGTSVCRSSRRWSNTRGASFETHRMPNRMFIINRLPGLRAHEPLKRSQMQLRGARGATTC